MPNSKKPKDCYDANAILRLFKKKLRVNIKRPAIYHYVMHHKFPPNTGWGRPRLWIKKEVDSWFKKQESSKR